MSIAAEDFGAPTEEYHLACLLFSPSGRPYLEQTLAEINPDDFTDPTFGWMWAAARIMHSRGEPINRRSLMALRDTAAPAKQVGEPRAQVVAISGLPFNAPGSAMLAARIGQVASEPVYLSRLHVSVRSVRESARMRRLAQTLELAYSTVVGASDYSAALESVHRMIGTVEGSEAPPEAMHFSELMDEFQEQQARGFELGEVIPTPWQQVNDLLSGGLHVGHSIVLAGRPGAGKSNAGLNLAMHAAGVGYPSLVFSQEMSGLEVAGRIAASGAQVEYNQITRRNMDPESWFAVKEFVQRNRQSPLWVIDKPGISIEYVAATTRTMKRKYGVKLAAVDYLQLVEPTDRRVIREQQVSHISRAGKLLARETGCAILMLAQLNRGNEKDNRPPTVADLRESGSLEQDCDVAILLHHEKNPDGTPSGMVNAIIGKNRFGRTDTVELRWHGHQARIG